jgi:hypothetical protein
VSREVSPFVADGRAATIRAALVGVAFTIVLTLGFGAYGWMLFVATPFFMGWMLSALVADDAGGLLRAIGLAILALVLCGVLLIATGLEGAICLAMALPLALPLVVAGVLVGHIVRLASRRTLRTGSIGLVLAVAAFVAPSITALDVKRTETAPLHLVQTSIEVDAPPARVWPHVVSFSELPAPTEWIFRAGVAHPERARIEGHGVGAVRYCEFSTGAFVEPITAWDEPRRLAFDVTQSAPPLAELNPFFDVHPPHMDGYLASERGEFRLEAIPGGRTRLIGTTWYRHHMYPDRYWQAWSDFVIHRIHGRVLRHIEGLAEGRGMGA